MSWIQTYSGSKFDFLDLEGNDYFIVDIAHALSNLCMFGGHSNFHYSIAQHSVYLSQQLPEELKLIGLLHNSASAYLGRLPSPIRRHFLPKGSSYRKATSEILSRVMSSVGISSPGEAWLPPLAVTAVHARMMMTAKNQICQGSIGSSELEEHFEPYDDLTIEWWTQSRAKNEFIWEFERLSGKKIHCY